MKKHTFKRGDIVRITGVTGTSSSWAMRVGDRCRLLSEAECGCWRADFNGHHNVEVVGGGLWYVGRGPGQDACSQDGGVTFELVTVKGTES